MRAWVSLSLFAFTLLSQETPSFRTGARLVELNVVVTGKGNTPVFGLAEGEFRIFENGKPQKIAFFASPSQAPAFRPEPLPPGLFTNRLEYTPGAPQGVTAIVLDVLNTGPADQVYARAHLARFLSKLSSDDLVAVYVLSNGLRVVHDFTDDRGSLTKLVSRLRSELPQGGTETLERLESDAQLLAQLLGEKDFEELGGAAASGEYQRMLLETRTEVTMNLLEQLAQHLAGVPGRKSLVWIGAGLPMAIVTFSPEIEEGRRMPYSTNNAARFRKSLQALADGNVAVYPVDPRGLEARTVFPAIAPNWRRPAIGPSPMPREWVTQPAGETYTAMEVFAKDTGGRATFNSNDLEGAIRRAADDLKAVYTLAYYTSLEDTAAKRELNVRVTRPGVEVLARRRVSAAKRESQPDVRSLLESPLSATGILLNGKVTRQRDRLHFVLQIEPGSLLLTRNGDRTEGLIEVFLAQIKATGERTVADFRMELRLSEAQVQKIAAEGLLLERTVPVAPDVERVRVLVRDPRSGAAGSFDAPLRLLPGQ